MTTKVTLTITAGNDTSNAVQLPDKVVEASVFLCLCEGTPMVQVSADNINWCNASVVGMASTAAVYTIRLMTQLSTCWLRVKLTSQQSQSRTITLLYTTTTDYTVLAQVGI